MKMTVQFGSFDGGGELAQRTAIIEAGLQAGQLESPMSPFQLGLGREGGRRGQPRSDPPRPGARAVHNLQRLHRRCPEAGDDEQL